MVDLAKLGLREEAGLDPEIQEAMFGERQSLDRPIPGESLTNDPNNPYPFEQSPEYTDRTEALEYLFKRFISEDVYKSLMNVINRGVPIMNLTEIFLYKGFSEGKWNPDLLMMLVEPTAYMIMALSERAGIDYVVMLEEEGEDEEGLAAKDKDILKAFNKKDKPSDLKQIDFKISKGSLPKEISEKLENLPAPKSLLAK